MDALKASPLVKANNNTTETTLGQISRPDQIQSIRFTEIPDELPDSMLLLWLPVIALAATLTAAAAESEKTTETPDGSSKFSSMIDTKYWMRTSEFIDRENWLDERKPCTLLEQIQINERAVVSMGDSAFDTLINDGGSLESNLKDLSLPMDGALLLEQSTSYESNDELGSEIDKMFIQYLNLSGDCLDSDSVGQQHQGDENSKLERFRFQFQIDSDDLSWFNPDNWLSEHGALLSHVPDSHSIPCIEDEVVFGDRGLVRPAMSFSGNERADTLTFKVNFAPSIYSNMIKASRSSKRVGNLRVSKLKIGDQSYSQSEFNALVSSKEYENLLFDFNNTNNLLGSSDTDDLYEPVTNLIIIDESSFIKTEHDFHVCLDEAGCVCGNEDSIVMDAICSFHLPLELDELPCHDPISSTGYCNKICGTSIIIIMDPSKFSEPFLNSVFIKLRESEGADHVELAPRRVYDNKYEITFRPAIGGNLWLWWALDYVEPPRLEMAREFANLFMNELTKPAIKSFYGIKSISIKSSSQWRSDSRAKIFWFSLAAVSLAAVSVVCYQELFNDRIDGGSPSQSQERFLQTYYWMLARLRRTTTNSSDIADPIIRCEPEASRLNISDLGPGREFSHIQLVDMENSSVTSHSDPASEH